MIFVEQDLGNSLPGQHRHQEADEYGLARSRRSADQGMTRVLAGPTVGIGRVAGM